MDKFQYNYSLAVEKASTKESIKGADPDSGKTTKKFAQYSNEFLEIDPPLTIDFDIIRNYLAAASTSSVKIYNLNELSRTQILKDNWDIYEPRRVILQAGYGESFSKIFFGNAIHVYSVRENVDFITSIEAFDGGNAYNNARFTSTTGSFKKGETYDSVINKCVKLLGPYGVEPGAVRKYPKKELKKGTVYKGAIIGALEALTNGEFYIDNGYAHALREEDVINNQNPTDISSSTGLIGTPRREKAFVVFNMVFQPSLSVGEKVNINSRTGKQYNGINKIVSIQHKGRISEAVGSKVTTEVGVLYRKKFTDVDRAKNAG